MLTEDEPQQPSPETPTTNPFQAPRPLKTASIAVGNRRALKLASVLIIIVFGLACAWLFQQVTPKANVVEDKQTFQGSVESFGARRGGAHVLMKNGAVKFLSEKTPETTIGDQVSPFGLWRALGTRAKDHPVRFRLDEEIAVPKQD